MRTICNARAHWFPVSCSCWIFHWTFGLATDRYMPPGIFGYFKLISLWIIFSSNKVTVAFKESWLFFDTKINFSGWVTFGALASWFSTFVLTFNRSQISRNKFSSWKKQTSIRSLKKINHIMKDFSCTACFKPLCFLHWKIVFAVHVHKIKKSNNKNQILIFCCWRQMSTKKIFLLKSRRNKRNFFSIFTGFYRLVDISGFHISYFCNNNLFIFMLHNLDEKR